MNTSMRRMPAPPTPSRLGELSPLRPTSVLQTGRAPAQLSLFLRPTAAR